MTPVINNTEFGSIIVDEQRYDHDIIIALDGKVKKISLDEIKYTYQDKSEGIVIGSGQYGVAKLSNEASEFLKNKHCKILLRPTPEAIQEWNLTEGKWIGLFHITC